MHRNKRRAPAPISILLWIPWFGFCLLLGGALAVKSAADAPLPTPRTGSAVFVPMDDAAPTETPAPLPALAVSRSAYGKGLNLRGTEPKILIYHTHTTEAYFPTAEFAYRKTSAWRTDDETRNVVAVGERLKQILEEDYGFAVIHDTTNHEPPKLADAYARSEQTMLAYAAKYPSIEVFIDLHRDAYGSDPKAPADYVTVNGQALARMMFVVGRGENYADKPYYETNRRFAERITAYLQSIDPKLARPIREKKGRYNQHVGAYCLLVEVGHNANTLEQALASLPYLAEGIAFAVAETEHTVTSWVP